MFSAFGETLALQSSDHQAYCKVIVRYCGEDQHHMDVRAVAGVCIKLWIRSPNHIALCVAVSTLTSHR